MGMLYVVPTPVGNMEDMTFRAIRILKEADLILAEDTRTSGILLKHYEIKNQLMSHHKFNEHGTTAGIVERLKAGATIALISDAGTPGISDPGFYLVREAVAAGQEVQCLPGATAFVPALVSSGPRLSCLHWYPADCPTTGSASRVSCRRRKVVRHVWRIYAMRSVRWCSMNHPTGW